MSPAPPQKAATCGQSGDPRLWNETQVSSWLLERGLPDEIAHAFEAHLVNGLLGFDLSKDDLISMGISDPMHQRRVSMELQQLFGTAEPEFLRKLGAPPPKDPSESVPAAFADLTPYTVTVQRRVFHRPRPRSAHALMRPGGSNPRNPQHLISVTPAARSGKTARRSCSPKHPSTITAVLKQHTQCIAQTDHQLAQLPRAEPPQPWRARPPRHLRASNPAAPPCAQAGYDVPQPAQQTPCISVPHLSDSRSQESERDLYTGPKEDNFQDYALMEAIRERNFLRDQLESTLKKFESKTESHGARFSELVAECDAMRIEIGRLQEKCDSQERALAESRQAKDVAEHSYQELLHQFASAEAARVETDAENVKQTNSTEHELALANWKAQEFERKCMDTQQELDQIRKEKNVEVAPPSLVPTDVKSISGSAICSGDATNGVDHHENEILYHGSQLDDLCEEFRLQVREMVQARISLRSSATNDALPQET